MGVKRSVLPPLCVLLLHLDACSEAIEWAGRRPITEQTLAQCERADWRAWIATELNVSVSAPFAELEKAALAAISGSGSGSGSGDGYGYGYGYGDGSGDGSGYGSGADMVVRA